MKKRLKTLEQLERDLKPLCSEWIYDDYLESISITYNSKKFYINDTMLEQLGTEIEVVEVDEKEKEDGYSYMEKSIHEYCYHELWFEPEFKPIEFLSEEEFMV